MRVVSSSALVLLIALSACGDAKEATTDERKTAAGEVLGGSISDAMLPLATVQSKSPPLRESASEGDEKAAAPGGDEPAPVAETATDSAPEPAAKPGADPPAETSE